MGFLYRVGQSKLRGLLCQLGRSYTQLPYRSSINSIYLRPCVAEIPHWVFHNRPTDKCIAERFFAAPIWATSKKEDNETGIRLNEQIKARFVRLVMDDGHSIVSMHEALNRARILKLDLVEVQRNADPPVCKIMDYHKEKYKREVKEKDRTKSKSENTLRIGEAKEVRFSLKTEQKDLNIKADSIKRLMERGYRVRCKVTGPDLRMGMNENLSDFEARIARHIEELEAALSRLSDMIADISVIESWPHATAKEASMIVRHEKFGPSKKGGAKTKKQVASIVTQTQSETSEAEDSADDNTNDNSIENRYKVTEPQKQYPSASPSMKNRGSYNSASVTRESFSQKPANVPENRYKPTEPQNRYQSAAMINNKGGGNSDSFRRDSFNSERQHRN